MGEIRDNHQTLQNSLPKLASNEQQTKTLLEALTKLRTDRHTQIPDMSLNFNMLILYDSSWKTAGTTGALGLMPHRQVKDFAGDYEVQENVNRVAQQLRDYCLSMTALNGDVEKLSEQQLDDVIHRVQLTLSHLQAVENLSRSLDAEYVKRLSAPN